MYELKRGRRINEDLKLGNDKIHLDISPDSIAKEYGQRYNDLYTALKKLDKYEEEGKKPEQFPEAFEAVGDGLISLLHLVFGEENTNKILEFYENNYIEMVFEVIPFINEVVTPEIEKYKEESHKGNKNKYVHKKRFRK